MTITNNAAMNIVEHMSLWHDLAWCVYTPSSDITGSCGRLFLNFLRNHHTDLQSGCTSLHSYQQWRSLSLTLHTLQHKLSSVFEIQLDQRSQYKTNHTETHNRESRKYSRMHWHRRSLPKYKSSSSDSERNINKCDFLKLRCFCKAKDTVNKTKLRSMD